MRSLWFKLSVYFTLITWGGVILFSVVYKIMFANSAFANTTTPNNIRAIALTEQPFFTLALKQKNTAYWLSLTDRNLLDKLINMPLKDDEEVNLKAIVEPKVYIRVYDPAGTVLYTGAQTLPEEIETIFSSQKHGIDVAEYLQQKDHIWVALPLQDENGIVQGSLSLLFIAKFDYRELITEIMMEYWYSLPETLSASIIIALACSIVANLFVTRPLTQIGQVTEEWCKGNFASRINVKAEGGDILAQHSRRLNFMADELENLLILKAQTAVNEERNWMAGELHDTVKQNLFALSLQLAAIKYKNNNAGTVEHIDEAERIVRESQQDIKAILTHFRPVEQEELGLIQRLDTLVEDTRRRYKVDIVWARKDMPLISKQQEHTLFRMTQEAISNSIRHGKASRIVLNLFSQNGLLFWSVADNGRGLPENWDIWSGSGLGLSFMNKRVENMPEGTLMISAVPEGGTLVSAQWRESV